MNANDPRPATATHRCSAGECAPLAEVDAAVNSRSSTGAKIALFRSLFRSRDDVHARRFESRRTGRAGYQPACGNEWVAGVCRKPQVKCASCPARDFLRLTDQVLHQHLSGRDDRGRNVVIGVYPLFPDDTCHWLAADFDRTTWQEDAVAFLDTCRRHAVPAALERSRSGNGGHVWLFFTRAVPARLARQLGSFLLTETMERRPDLGLGSYDRFFPNQDTLPKGGFGNLIALPLQREPRARGNSVFLDDRLEPHPDQWAFLSAQGRIDPAHAEALVQEAEQHHRVLGVRTVRTDADDDPPWTAPPSRRPRDQPIVDLLPPCLEAVLADQIYLPKESLPPALANRLIRLAAFQNPVFLRAQAMRLSTHNIPRLIACAEDHPGHLALPRGCLGDLEQLLAAHKVKLTVRDERSSGSPLTLTFRGTLRPEQQVAADALLAHDIGVLAAGTAFGKTVVAAWLIARRGVNTLVLVHRRQILEQWVQRLSTFLGVAESDIGRIGGGQRRPNGTLDVALIQSLFRKQTVDDRVADYGHLVVDECHHLAAHSFEQVARRARARFVTGLSATVTRQDGHHPILFMQCGPVRHRVDAKRQAATHPFLHRVLVHPTTFRPAPSTDSDPLPEFQRLCQTLAADDARNQAIAADILAAVQAGRHPLVLTERTDHLEDLANRLSGPVDHLIILRGGMRRKAWRTETQRLASLPETARWVLLATGRFIGEGFDDARLDTLFLTLPVSWRGTIAQYAGRLHRLHGAKREVWIHDYADLNVPVLARMFQRRCRAYEAVGYTIQLPASAVPGWPAEVPLPADPDWRRRYAASVRRLAVDGVDGPLATLFARATRTPSADADGADRARSAVEAFLYRRLETLPDFAGRFRLNVPLPIPFAGHSHLEVDLLCADAGLVVEIDGAQHLNDPEAYRRDRRKDALLQENGYFVLRFLAEDIGPHLDHTLDQIHRSLVHRRNPRPST